MNTAHRLALGLEQVQLDHGAAALQRRVVEQVVQPLGAGFVGHQAGQACAAERRLAAADPLAF